MSNEKMRAEFEVWYAEYVNTGFSVSRAGTWAAWQASRAALVVELPDAIEIWDEASYPPSSYAYLNLKSVIEAIKKTGAIVK